MSPFPSPQEIQSLKHRYDLRVYIPQDTGIQTKVEGNITRLATCPFCGHRDCFTIWNNNPHHYHCFSCGKRGDVLNYLAESRHIDFKKAFSLLSGESNEQIAYTPVTIESIKKDEKKRVQEARNIWNQSRKLSQEEIASVLEQRHFPEEMRGMAGYILGNVARLNVWEDNWVIVPQFLGEELTGICRIWLPNTSRKLDLGKKGVFFFEGRDEKKKHCIIVESFFNGLCLNALGYSSLVMFSCSNKTAMENTITRIKGNYSLYFFLDRGVEEIQEEYCKKHNIPGLWFEREKENGYDINNLLQDCGSESVFEDKILGYVLQAAYQRISVPVSKFIASVIESVGTAYQKIEKSQEKSHGILAPTGAGKTTDTAKKIAERLRAKLPTLYVASQKSDMYQFREVLNSFLSEEEQKRVQIVSMEEKSSIKEFRQDTCVITHKTYFTRKGMSPYHYAAMLWSGHKKAPRGIWVIIDEVQAYIENQKFLVKRGGRYAVKEFDDHGIRRKEICEECNCFNNRGSCMQCRISEENYLYCNGSGILEIATYIEGRTGKDFSPEKLPVVEFQNEVKHKTLTVRKIKQGEKKYRHYASEKTFDDPTLEKIFLDLLDCAYKPKCYRFNPITKEQGEIVDWSDLKTYFNQAEFCSKTDKEATEEKRKIKENYTFPKTACDVDIYEFLDKSSLEYLASNSNIEKIIFLGATLREDQKEFLQACCPDLQLHEIKEAKHKLDDLSIVIFKKKFDFVKAGNVEVQGIVNSLQENQRILVFTPKKSQTWDEYKKFPKDYPVAILNGDDTIIDERKINPVNKKGESDYRVGITWENGPLGRGINRPYDYVAFVDAANYLPIIAYGHSEEITPEKVEEGYRAKIEDTTTQCGGRILRRGQDEAKKIIVVHNTEEIEPNIQSLIEKWQGMVAKPISFRFVEEEQGYLLAVCESWLKDGKFPEQSEREFAREKLAEKPKELMSKLQREKVEENKEDYQETREEIKNKKRLERLIEKGKILKEEGKNLMQIYDILNMFRYKDLWETVKQELGFTS